jgi:hypothetical protein
MRPLHWLSVVAALLILARAGVSAPLEPEACAKLKDEEAELARKGAKTNLAKGPEWAKTNLTQTGIDDVRRLIEVEEQVQFRCPVPAPPAAKEAAKPKVAKKAKAATAEQGAEKGPKQAPQAKSAKAGEGTAKQAQPSKAPDEKSAPKKQAPRPKNNDAYVPPKTP